MQIRIGQSLAVMVVAVIAVIAAACAQPSSVTPAKIEAVVVEKIEGSDLERLALSPQAAQRLGVQTSQVEASTAGGSGRMAVPYSALIYDKDGATWVYTSAEDLVFVRHEVTVDHIVDDLAILTAGPILGALVVTVGAAELWGVETGVGGGH